MKTCSEEQVTTFQNEDECSDIIDIEPSSHQEEREDQFKKNDVRVKYRDLSSSIMQ